MTPGSITPTSTSWAGALTSGFPGTDRESPALVSEAMDELRKVYPVERYFVGGHSQGGYLTYVMLMHFPEKIAGAFPISCEVMIQCEPDVFNDEALRAAQRLVPLAIVHGKTDPNVDFASGRQLRRRSLRRNGWPGLRLFASETAGHKFMLLPVGEAIRWLEIDGLRRPQGPGRFRREAGQGRTSIATPSPRSARPRTSSRPPPRNSEPTACAARSTPRRRRRPTNILIKIKANRNGSWVDSFLAFRDQFEFSDGARPAMAAFEALRKKQEPDAQRLFNEAIMQFRQGNQADGYEKYQELVEKDYASSRYRNVKEQLKARK